MKLDEALKQVSTALRPLHLALVDHTKIAYERSHGSVGGPGQLLQLLTTHTDFNWLHPLSELMAWIDEMVDPKREPRPQPEEAAAVRNELQRMLGITLDTSHPFAVRYLGVLQESPDAVLAHSAVREALRALAAVLG